MTSELPLPLDELQWAEEQLADLCHPVTLRLNPSPEVPEIVRELLSRLDKMSDFIMISETESLEAGTFFVLSAEGAGELVYKAIPVDHEWRAFISALREFSGLHAAVPQDARERCSALPPLSLSVVVSSHCPHCERIVRMVTAVASHNPGMSVAIIDASLCPEYAADRDIQSVPMICCDDRPVFSSSVELGEFLGYCQSTGVERLKLDILFSLQRHDLKSAAEYVRNHPLGPDALSILVTSPALSTRIAVITLIEEMQDDRELLGEMIPIIMRYLESDDIALVCDIIMALAAIGDQRTAKAIKKLLDSENEDIRESAEEALNTLREKRE